MRVFRPTVGLVLLGLLSSGAWAQGISVTAAASVAPAGSAGAVPATPVTVTPVTPPILTVPVTAVDPTVTIRPDGPAVSVAPVPPPTPPNSVLTPGAGAVPMPRLLRIQDPAWSGSTNVIDVSTPRTGSFPARLSNVSVRGYVSANAPLIGGGAITGASALPTFVRATGPTLKSFGVDSALPWPSLSVYEGGAMAAETNYVQPALAPVASYVGTFPSMAGDPSQIVSTDAALVGRPLPGNLTALCTSGDDSAGIALIEFFDASNDPSASSPRFHNFSGRAQIVGSDGVLIIGFVVAGEGEITLLLRGVGSSLAAFGVTGTIPDPIIELHDGSTVVASSDNWRAETRGSTVLADTAAKVGAFALTDPNEAALLITLRAGAYSLVLRDTQNRGGIGLAEIYEVPAAN